MSTYDLATINVLWRRDLLRFWRQPSRVVGALGQPLLFWLIIGSGFASTFVLPGQNTSYLEFFFPGVVVMVLLFASIFSAVSLIEDRHQGFLQAILGGPSSRVALLLGKSLGASAVALLQAGFFVLLAPAAGVDLAAVNWPLLLSMLVLTAFGLSALGFAMAWWLDNVQAYHAIQMVLLMPLWIVSGAMFPPSPDAPILQWLMRLNPLAYAVSGVRHSLYAPDSPARATIMASPATAFTIVTLFALSAAIGAALLCRRAR